MSKETIEKFEKEDRSIYTAQDQIGCAQGLTAESHTGLRVPNDPKSTKSPRIHRLKVPIFTGQFHQD